jgi:hypothetical protein
LGRTQAVAVHSRDIGRNGGGSGTGGLNGSQLIPTQDELDPCLNDLVKTELRLSTDA